MELKEFLDLYDNWNGLVTINDDELMETGGDAVLFRRNIIQHFIDHARNDTVLMRSKVISFGFYDDELCIRVNLSEGWKKLKEYKLFCSVTMKTYYVKASSDSDACKNLACRLGYPLDTIDIFMDNGKPITK